MAGWLSWVASFFKSDKLGDFVDGDPEILFNALLDSTDFQPQSEYTLMMANLIPDDFTETEQDTARSLLGLPSVAKKPDEKADDVADKKPEKEVPERHVPYEEFVKKALARECPFAYMQHRYAITIYVGGNAARNKKHVGAVLRHMMDIITDNEAIKAYSGVVSRRVLGKDMVILDLFLHVMFKCD